MSHENLVMLKQTNLPKLIVLLGPTASGKTAWGLRLAKELKAAVISADSRQIYKKMTIGTGKPDGTWRPYDPTHEVYEVEGVPHFLMDIIDPGRPFTLSQFREEALTHIALVQSREQIPILVGGTGLYISSLVDNFRIPQVPPNKKLRKSLEEKTTPELLRLLKQLDPEALKFIDVKNTRRVIRALEVCMLTNESFTTQRKKDDPIFDILQIGIAIPREILYKRIDERVDEMVERGLVHEVDLLIKQRYGWDLPSMSGIGYRQFRAYIEEKVPLETIITHLKQDTHRFARRQMTWFRRDKRIQWVERYEDAENLIKEFLLKK